jgi:hypothetical protein
LILLALLCNVISLCSKLGVPIKTTVSATVLEEALNGTVEISQLLLGKSVCRKVGKYFPLFFLHALFLPVSNVSNFCACWQVEKQTAHFYSVDITDKEAKMGLVCRVHSTAKSKFKVRREFTIRPTSIIF